MTDSILRASPATASLALVILLAGISLPSVASAQTAEERLTALENALAERKAEIANLEGQVKALRKELSPSPTVASSDECSIDTAVDRGKIFDRTDTINRCTDLAMNPGKATTTSTPPADAGRGSETGQKVDRIDRRGFAGRVDATGDSTEATLQYTTSSAFRRLLSPKVRGGEARQQIVSRDWTFGIRGEVDKGEKRARLGSLNELQSGIRGFIKFGQHYFVPESRSTVLARAEKKFPAQAAACKAEKATKPDLDCDGGGLLAWMFDRDADKNGMFARPDSVSAYNDVYWASGYEKPVYGWGFDVSLGRPKFTYFPFATTTITDPFNPSETKTVIDPSQFPADFASQTVKDETHLNWTVGGYAYLHGSSDGGPVFLPPDFFSWSAGTTLIGSVTYKHEWAIDEDFKDLTICPAPAAGATFVDPFLCAKGLNGAAPAKDPGFVFGIEMRQMIDSPWFRVLPPLGISAKYTYQTSNGRNGLEVPLYFATDKDGALTGGLRFAREWGGTKADGSPFKTDSQLGIFFGASFDVHGGK